MTDVMLDEVETALGRKLPAAYRRFMTTHPPRERGHYISTLYGAPGRMIRRNRGIARWPDSYKVRERDGAGGWLPDRPWPADWLAVGDANGESYLFARPDDPGVWDWQHDTLEVDRVAGSFEALLAAAQAEKAPPAEPEPFTHPELGELLWHPDSRWWTGNARTPAGGTMTLMISPPAGDREAALAAAVALLPRAQAAEPAAFAAAVADRAFNDADGSAADALRGQLDGPSLHLDLRGDRPVWYSYDTGGRFNADDLLIALDADLRYFNYYWVF